MLKHKKFLQANFDNISQTEPVEVYVVTESVFSMDGDSPDLIAMSKICKKHNAFFVVDEAHAVGVFDGGLVQKQNLEDEIFARIITFGKALGCHGAVILGSRDLKDYLVNFARSFIYTTALSPHSLATIQCAYNEMLKQVQHDKLNLSINIQHFQKEIKRLSLNFITSNSAIHCCVISGNKKVKEISKQLQEKNFDVKAVLSPTVPKGKERLRFCLHAYNTNQEITKVLELLYRLQNK
jgi:8-amino-7-oxononanoate synthase